MSHNNGIISAPVNLSSDVVAIIGGDSRVSAVCTSPKINPWAKYKPVYLADKFPDRTKEWWRGANGKCGIIIASKSNPSQIDGTEVYAFDTPNAPYRLADFNGYNHYAKPTACMGEIGNISVIAGGDTTTFALDLYTNLADSLNLWDIDVDGKKLGDMYFCMAIFNASGTAIFYASANNPIKVGNAYYSRIEADLSKLGEFNTGDYTFKFFLSNVKVDSTTSAWGTNGKVVPLPFIQNVSTPVQTVVMKRVSAFNMTFLNLVAKNSTGTWLDVKNYVSYSSPFVLDSARSKIYIKYNVVNNSARSQTFMLNDFQVEGGNWNGTTDVRRNTTIYDENGTRITSSFTVASGASKVIVVEWAYNYTNTGTISPTGIKTIQGKVSLYYGGMQADTGGAGFFVTFNDF